MEKVELEYDVPSSAMSDYVTLFYRFRAEVPFFEDTERADHAQLRFRLTPGKAEYTFANGNVLSAPPLHVIGPTSGPMQVRVDGPVRVFGMGLTPAGWAALIGTDASSMLNRVVGARELLGDEIIAVARALATVRDIKSMVAIVEPLLLDLAQREKSHAEFVRLVDAWLADSPSPDVEQLVAASGLSARQIERKCKALYGVPPKFLARKYRALRAAVALVAEGATPAEVVERGFYDQSHLIREIKQFTGLTPGQMHDHPGLLAQLTMNQRTALKAQVAPIISDT
ncbi:helix-turn-helix domain-containing protein [Stakelama marina]|uniref:Helix-turn-helix transcriptional regulator n=1 Tax=Stakelama marina TaxID=2826939 RepID=A0A8T4IJT3_9SPHN|nr:AraC family transcriptional regulator [Stakelama marina]MBR0552609.1 helix-turn-helix transcriptional regulator [Stakelama marina]